jgi:DNA-binding transcriptional LysR family regulator
VDMAVRIGRLPDSSMVATQVGTMRTVACASPALLAAHGAPRSPTDLVKFPCVTIDAPAPAPAWRFRAPRTGAAIDVPVRPRLVVNAPEAAAEAAIRGVGITRLLHYQAAGPIRRRELKVLLAAYEPEPLPIHLLHAARGHMPLKMRRFLDYAAPRLRRIGTLRS